MHLALTRRSDEAERRHDIEPGADGAIRAGRFFDLSRFVQTGGNARAQPASLRPRRSFASVPAASKPFFACMRRMGRPAPRRFARWCAPRGYCGRCSRCSAATSAFFTSANQDQRRRRSRARSALARTTTPGAVIACLTPNMATFNVMLNDADGIQRGSTSSPAATGWLQESVYDSSTGYKLWVIPKERMIEVMRNSPPPVAVTGQRRHRRALLPPQCAACLRAQSFGRGSLSRHIYVSCNAVANKLALGPNPRPDWVVSRNWFPLPVEDDEGVTKAA